MADSDKRLGPALREVTAGTCLLCHTVNATVTQAGLEAGEYWRCERCGQMWDASRLSAARAYGPILTPQ